MAGAPRYAFLPWVRRGLAGSLPDADTLGDGVPPRARLAVTARVSRRAGAVPPVQKTVEVLGPGDVAGLDPRQVIRTDPLPGATDAEPNYLVQVELDRPDLPWLFTPAAATADGLLRPWLVLVVVELGRVEHTGPSKPGGLGVLEVGADADPSRQLPDLAESWAWAHGQAMLADGEAVEAVLGVTPQRDAARLLCPRRLDPTTSYLACIVPAFEAGRLAGLGLDPDAAADGVPPPTSLQPAWTAASTKVTLPVYYAWSFTTGAGGDFESMVRALRPRPLPPGVGRQRVYVGAAGPPLPAVDPASDGGIVELPGALVLPGSELPPWPAATKAQVEAGLKGLVDVPARRVGAAPGGGGADADPAVTPPLYGRWPAARATVPEDGEEPAWLRAVNVDPRHRAVAGAGAAIVEAEQERLMDVAWSQVGAVEQANRELRWAQMGREVRASLLRRHVAPLPAGEVLGLTSAVHRRLPARSATVAIAVSESALPDATVRSRFRRAVAPTGALARRAQAAPGSGSRIVEALDGGALSFGVSGAAPDGLFGFANAAPAGTGVPADVRTAIANARTAAATRPAILVDRGAIADVVVTQDVANRVGAVLARPPSVETVARLRDATAAAIARADAVVGVPRDPPAPALGVASIAAEILDGLDPHATVLARIRHRVRLPERAQPRPGRDPLEQIMAAPVYEQPVWELFRDHAPELLLPGLDRIPQDSATLAETNPAFAEASLVGINHELARELLWREYPTDQRGTCFARFWAPGGTDDIPAIHRWNGGDLGAHTTVQADGRLVLVLRGRLLYRYPHTVIYAAPDEGGRPDMRDEAVRLPTFRGRIEPDVAFCGFALTLDEALAEPGWWFVLEEQPTAPRFGLDVADGFGGAAAPVHQWNDLSWGHLAPDAQSLAQISHLRADMAPPSPPAGPRWGTSSAGMAAILVQQPVRVALRAIDLLAPA